MKKNLASWISTIALIIVFFIPIQPSRVPQRSRAISIPRIPRKFLRFSVGLVAETKQKKKQKARSRNRIRTRRWVRSTARSLPSQRLDPLPAQYRQLATIIPSTDMEMEQRRCRSVNILSLFFALIFASHDAFIFWVSIIHRWLTRK